MLEYFLGDLQLVLVQKSSDGLWWKKTASCFSIKQHQNDFSDIAKLRSDSRLAMAKLAVSRLHANS